MERSIRIYTKYTRWFTGIVLSAFVLLSCSKDVEKMGKELPEFSLINQEGKEFKSTQMDEDIYILSVLTNWCSPCTTELRELNELRQKFNPELNIVLATSDSLSWLAEDSLDFRWYYAPTEFFQRLKIKAIPTRILIKDGRELLRIEGVGPLECQQFEDSLANLLPDLSRTENKKEEKE